MEDIGILYYKSKKIFIGEINLNNSLACLISDKSKYFGIISDGKKNGFGSLEQDQFNYIGEF